MKKLIFALALAAIFTGCTKENIAPPTSDFIVPTSNQNQFVYKYVGFGKTKEAAIYSGGFNIYSIFKYQNETYYTTLNTLMADGFYREVISDGYQNHIVQIVNGKKVSESF